MNLALLVLCLWPGMLRADLNGDGRVDLSDLAILASEWMQEEDSEMKLGPELVTNGDFKSAQGWTVGVGWIIDTNAGKAVYSKPENAPTDNLQRTVDLLPNTDYLLGARISNLSIPDQQFMDIVSVGVTVVAEGIEDGVIFHFEGYRFVMFHTDPLYDGNPPAQLQIAPFFMLAGKAVSFEITGITLRQVLAGAEPVPHSTGILTQVRDWAVAALEELEEDGIPVFKTCQPWIGQIGAADGGEGSFGRYAPFAFVRTLADRVDREGAMAAAIYIHLDIVVGAADERPGVCLSGAEGVVGTDRMIEKVICRLDRRHPGEGIVCDDFFLTDCRPVWVRPKQSAVQLHFEAKWISV